MEKTVGKIIQEINELTEEKNNYGAALKELRSKANWKSDIEKDGRTAVKKLFAMYLDTDDKINKLLDLKVNG